MPTSVLPWLSAPLCDAVTSGSGAQEQLDLLWHRSVFVVPLDRSLDRLRYHHLFADLLRQEFSRRPAEEQQQVRLRAADWFLRQRSRGRGHRAVDRRPGVATARSTRSSLMGRASSNGVSQPPWWAGSSRLEDGWADAPPELAINLLAAQSAANRFAVGPRDLPRHHPPPRPDSWRAGGSGRVVRLRRAGQPQRAGGHRSQHVGAGRQCESLGPEQSIDFLGIGGTGQRRADRVVHDGVRPVPPGTPRQRRSAARLDLRPPRDALRGVARQRAGPPCAGARLGR